MTTPQNTPPTTTTHPAARCGTCENCRHIDATRRIVLAHSAPAGPGIGQREADLWNDTLRQHPCSFPLVWVDLPVPHAGIFKGRITVAGAGNLTVNTAEHGLVSVRHDQIREWTPATALDGIEFTTLLIALSNMPMSWYPRLLSTLMQAAQAKNVFEAGGLTRLAQRVEQGEEKDGN